MSDTETTFDTKGLDALLKAFKHPPIARVGVLGDKDARHQGGATSNATVGAAHEYGTSKLPQRSFLRVPLTDNLQRYLENSGAFTEDVLKKVVKEGSITEWMKKIGLVAEGLIHDAFDTGGFGKWKPSNMANKTVHQTLVETTQLRNSITSDVREA